MADAKQGKAPEDFYNVSSQSRVVLAKPRLGAFGSSSFASSSNKTSNSFGSVLRPSQLKPTVNPFSKATDPSDLDETNKEESNEDRLKGSEEADVPMFVPLGSNARTGNPVPAPAQSTSSTSSAFVFGQNLSARVFIENVNNGEANNGEIKADHSSTNGTELLFTSAAASVKENNQEEGSGATAAPPGSSGPGLAAAAAEYERSHARPPPPAASYNLTGEEGETNVLQISCRLFAWESGSWRERGRGVLRLNDCAAGDGGGARLVARVAGSLRVVLNTKLWPDMVADRAGTKSLRITAADAHNTVKLFLIMGAPVDIAQLHRALTTRIAVSKRTAPATTCNVNATSQQAAERLEAAADDAEYLDKTDSDTTDTKPDKPDTDHNERLDPGPKQKTEEYESNVDGMKEDHEARSLKRKEQADDKTPPKRQCPDIKE